MPRIKMMGEMSSGPRRGRSAAAAPAPGPPLRAGSRRGGTGHPPGLSGNQLKMTKPNTAYLEASSAESATAETALRETAQAEPRAPEHCRALERNGREHACGRRRIAVRRTAERCVSASARRGAPRQNTPRTTRQHEPARQLGTPPRTTSRTHWRAKRPSAREAKRSMATKTQSKSRSAICRRSSSETLAGVRR